MVVAWAQTNADSVFDLDEKEIRCESQELGQVAVEPSLTLLVTRRIK